MLSVMENEREPILEQRLACPKCGSADVRRSHTGGFAAAVLRMVGRWPFRCRSCRSRFYHATPPD
jgi:predicted RNA-binding Zn-ribbon protein involved in translation (DUF1610 family)